MMKRTSLAVTSLLLLLTLLWLQAEPLVWFSNLTIWQYRSAFVQLSGIIAVTLMSVVIVLALRLPLVERFTQGLDKAYHLHKWLGISALLSAIIHWICAVGPKYAIGWGMLEKPARHHQNIDPDSLVALIRPLRSVAEELGELFFYAMLLLGVLSLLSLVGYKLFKLSHKLMAISFIGIAYHSAVLLSPSYWSYPITYITLIIIAIGLLAAIWSLSGKIGKKRTYEAYVQTFSHDDDNQVTDLCLSVPAWQGHISGQFAYLNFGGNNIHPFTIANADHKEGKLHFLIKELGDFTKQLKNNLAIGQKISIEGPYGKFDFNDQHDQLWIAGGIGIAAFRGMLQARQSVSFKKSITLYYCTLNPSIELIKALQQEADLAKVDLRISDGRHDPLLTVTLLNTHHTDLKARSIWFCGPVKFSHKLTQDLSAMDYDLTKFHREYFSMR